MRKNCLKGGEEVGVYGVGCESREEGEDEGGGGSVVRSTTGCLGGGGAG